MINHLLVICLGNICRSPMAEVLLKKALPNKTISSAGLTGITEGWMADPSSIRVMNDHHMDLSLHRAKPLTADLLKDVDLVLTMELEQIKTIETRFPETKGKVMRLGHYLNCDIPDPFNHSLEVFYKTYDLINKSIESFVSKHPGL